MSDKSGRDIYDTVAAKPKTSGNEEKIKAEIERLSKKGYPTSSDIIELYKTFKNEEAIVEEILRQSVKQRDKMIKRARELARKLYKKYVEKNMPLHEILNRLMKYKTEHKWSDSQYDYLRKELNFLLTGDRAQEIDYNQNMDINRSRITRALGITQPTVYDGLNIKKSEEGTLNKILAMYEKTSSLHKSIFMHSLMYQDCSLVAMTGEYDRKRNIANNYIHPLFACMFLPKFEIFEIIMLYANFGSIIKTRNDRKPIVNEPDALLYSNITSDPNDVVCDIESPLTDLMNRYNVQIKLWETVRNLRDGKYYEADSVSELLSVLNTCRNNLYDNADLVYNQDDGALLRRLLSVFSLRPTIIYTMPLSTISSIGINTFGYGAMKPNFGMFGGSPIPQLGWNNFAFNNQPVHTLTSIPMITLQLPQYRLGSEPIDLRNAISQTIWINENNSMIPKELSIIYSNEVLIFYVNRKSPNAIIKTYSNPLNFSQLPLTMSGFDRLNSYPVNVPDRLTLERGQETYHLRSVVAVTETEIQQGNSITKLITGSTGLIMSHRNLDRAVFEQSYYLYDPFGASIPIVHPSGDGYTTNKPISRIAPYFTTINDDQLANPSFFDRASRNGTIFIYAKPTGYNPNEIIIG